MTTWLKHPTAVLAEVKRRLGTITVANGYRTDIGLKLFVSRSMVPSEKQMPCVQIMEGAEIADDQANGETLTSKPFQICGFEIWKTDDENDAADLMGDIAHDIKRAIFRDGSKWDREHMVNKIEYIGTNKDPRVGGSKAVETQVVFRVLFVEDLKNS